LTCDVIFDAIASRCQFYGRCDNLENWDNFVVSANIFMMGKLSYEDKMPIQTLREQGTWG